MIVAKTIGVTLAFLLSFQVSTLADTTRVEAYHNSKHYSGPSRSDVDRSHQYVQSRRIGSQHRRHHLVQTTPQHLHASHHIRPSHRRIGHHDRRGVFYRPSNQGFQVVQAPIGAIISSLPIGYTHMRISDRDYYRYNDVYYQREFGAHGYQVVHNPYMNQTFCYQAGDMIDTLPLGASAVIIDNVRYYEYNNYYFRPKNRGGLRMYLVVDF